MQTGQENGVGQKQGLKASNSDFVAPKFWCYTASIVEQNISIGWALRIALKYKTL